MANTKLKGKVYRPALWRRLLAITMLIGIPIQAMIMWHSIFQSDEPLYVSIFISVFLLLIVVGGLVGCYQYAFRTCLIVSDSGIELQGIYKAYTTWDAADKFDWSGVLKNRAWGIMTIRPLDYKAGYWQALFRDDFVPLSHIIGRPPHRKVEMVAALIGVDLDKFAETPLGQDLLHYAPHLFETEKAKV